MTRNDSFYFPSHYELRLPVGGSELCQSCFPKRSHHHHPGNTNARCCSSIQARSAHSNTQRASWEGDRIYTHLSACGFGTHKWDCVCPAPGQRAQIVRSNHRMVLAEGGEQPTLTLTHAAGVLPGQYHLLLKWKPIYHKEKVWNKHFTELKIWNANLASESICTWNWICA